MPNRTTLLLFLFFPALSLSAQDYSGTWEGILINAEPEVRYHYTVTLEQEGHQLKGSSVMKPVAGGAEQRWKLQGIADARSVRFSETEALEGDESCWKGLRLTWVPRGDTWQLKGNFSATNCSSGGTVALGKKAGDSTPIADEDPLAGYWQGVLTQDDKEYNFAYEMALFDAGSGGSSIAIEYGGGVGDHYLSWQRTAEGIAFEETQLLYDRSEANFFWCFKGGTLALSETESHYVLEGPWSGMVNVNSPCSPGMVRLQKPKNTPREEPPETDNYTQREARRIQVVDELRANSLDLSLTVYDNAQEDGDIISVFLNSEPVLDRIETTKEEQEFSLRLLPGENYLIFHAENLGSSPPNTAALVLRAEGLRRRIILRSDLQTSGTIRITVPE